MTIQIKRVYDQPADTDGLRILVDRLWPRGLKKEKAAVEVWARDVAPSTELRQWFSHDPEKWDTFRDRYTQELDARPEAVAELRQHMGKKRVTLLYGAKDEQYNNAAALREYLLRK